MDTTTPRERAASFAARLLTAELAELAGQVARAHGGDPAAVHQARIAVRRLRSTLGSYAAVLTFAAEGARLDGELRWLGAALAPARDAHVIQEHLLARLDAEPADFTVGPVRARIRSELDAAELLGRREGQEALDSARYRDLVGALEIVAEAWAGTPAARTPAARTPGIGARKASRRALRRDTRRLLRAIKDARSAPPEARDAALHRVRKRAKRLRYAAEPAVAVLGAPARRLARAAQRLQTTLGDHQDSVVVAEQVLRLGRIARDAGESGVTYDRLHALESASWDTASPRLHKAARRLRRRLRQLG